MTVPFLTRIISALGGKNGRPLLVVGTVLPQCRVRRPLWSQGVTPRLPPAKIDATEGISTPSRTVNRTSVLCGPALNILSHTAGTYGSPTNPTRMGIR